MNSSATLKIPKEKNLPLREELWEDSENGNRRRGTESGTKNSEDIERCPDSRTAGPGGRTYLRV